jgi:glycosyltransferase involved in cell wall biosynthesis
MDLQPELSISAGLISKNSLTARIFTKIGNFIIRKSDKIISLDCYMTNYLVSRGAKPSNIYTIPVWPVLNDEYIGDRLMNPFRIKNGFGSKIVVMYSGNHAFVHPLDTLLNAAYELRNNSRFLFVFIGGGVRKKDVTDFREKHKLNNIIQLPFQPRENIHNSLGSSDIQVVILGNGQVGFTHPNKVYGALFIGRPILYIGPKESHVGDILTELNGNIAVDHGKVNDIVNALLDFAKLSENERETIGNNNRNFARKKFDPNYLKTQLIDAINS